MRGDARKRILETACRLFYETGLHATGIDTIVAHSGVTKMTLYKHFPSKQDLILAVLQHRDTEWRAWFQAAVEARTAHPADRLPALFDVLDVWFEQDDFKGCAFLKAAAEYPDASHPVHRIGVEHIRLVGNYILELAIEAGAHNAAALADSLNLLLMGAIAIAFAGDRPQIVQQAQWAANFLLDAHGVTVGSKTHRSTESEESL